jgi:hypothetical protein
VSPELSVRRTGTIFMAGRDVCGLIAVICGSSHIVIVPS